MGPHSNQVRYYYVARCRQRGGYLPVGSGTPAGAVEDAVMPGPL
jgi:hypothetical protein